MNNKEAGVSWVHRLVALVAALAFTTLTLAALITSNAALGMTRRPAGLAAFSWAHWAGGTRYEPAFRLLVAAAAVLAALIALWLSGSRAARSTKVMGWATAMAAGLNWWLADIPLASEPPPLALSAHAAVANAFFGLAVGLAILTRTDWNWAVPKSPDIDSPSFRTLLVFTTAATFLSSLLGTQTLPSVFPHLLSGCVVTFASLWGLEIALNKFPRLAGLKIPAILLAELAGVELFLGIVAHSMELNARVSPQPLPGLAVINATHAAVGAMMLAASLFAALQAFRYLAPRSAEAVAPAALTAEAEAEALDSE